MTTELKQKLKLKPLADRVLVKRAKEEEETVTGGIILPDTAKQKQEIGQVIAVGPGKKDKDGNVVEMPVKVGDQVMWDKYGGQDVSIGEEEFIIVKADDITVTVE